MSIAFLARLPFGAPLPRGGRLMYKRPRTVCMKVPTDPREKLVTFAVNRGVDREVATRVIESAQRAVRDWTSIPTEFLTPPESAALTPALDSIADLNSLPWGGFEDAERRAFFLAHSEVVSDDAILKQLAEEQLVLLKVVGNFEFDKASHRDFMGAVLGAGISRQKVGDIIVLDQRGAEVIVHADVAPFLESAVTQVRQVKVSVQQCAFSELEIPPQRIKEVQSVEASMRMDAVVSAGFKLSRSKLADMARGGMVQVNYREVRSPAKNVSSGDIVSVRGVGKLEIGEVSTTSKGKFRVMMKRYI